MIDRIALVAPSFWAALVALCVTLAAAFRDAKTGEMRDEFPAIGIVAGWALNGLPAVLPTFVALALGVVQIEKFEKAPFKFGDVLLFAALAALLPPLAVLLTFGLAVAIVWTIATIAPPTGTRLPFGPAIFGALAVVLTLFYRG